ncbi:MAG: hypothetical protein AAF492_14750 [Verrucomicrobiota bacterium]
MNSLLETDPHETTPSRWALVRAAAAGDDEAREEFCQIYYPVLTAFLRNVKKSEPDIATEVANDVLAKFCHRNTFRNLDPGDGQYRLRDYLYKSVQYAFYDRLAKDYTRKGRQAVSLDDLEDKGVGLTGELPDREERAFVREWIERDVEEIGESLRDWGEPGEEEAVAALIAKVRGERRTPDRVLAELLGVSENKACYFRRRFEAEFRKQLFDRVASTFLVDVDTEDVEEEVRYLLRVFDEEPRPLFS